MSNQLKSHDMYRVRAAEIFGVRSEQVTAEQRRYAKTAAYVEQYSVKSPLIAASFIRTDDE